MKIHRETDQTDRAKSLHANVDLGRKIFLGRQQKVLERSGINVDNLLSHCHMPL